MDEQQVGARRLRGHGGPRGAQRPDPAPPDRPGNGDGAEGTTHPFGMIWLLALTLILIPNGVG